MTLHQHLKKYTATCWLKATQCFDSTAWQITSEYLIMILRLAIMLLIWKSLAAAGVDLQGFTEGQLLTYTLLSSAFHHQFTVVTTATSALWEGSILNRYTRPVPVLGNFIAETFGRWIPGLFLYTLLVLVLSPLIGINPLPASVWDGVLFLLSFGLSVSLGFAIDFIFAAFALNLKNGCWIAMSIREAISSLLSGELIPLALLPFGIGKVFGLLPMGSLASTPLMIYLGKGTPSQILLQVFWNVVLWYAAVKYFAHNQENMVSFGG